MKKRILLKNAIFDINFLYLYLVPGAIISSVIPWVSLKLLVSFLMVFSYFLIVRNFRVSIVRGGFLLYPLIITLLTSFSLIYSLKIAIFDDVFEMLRPISAILFVLFVYQFHWDEKQLKDRIYSSCFYIIVFFFSLYLFELISFPVLGDIHELYRREKDALGGKFVGPFFTTYIAGSLMLAMCSMYFARFIIEKKFSFLVLALLASFLVVATQSRSAFMAYAMLVFYFYLVAFLVHKGNSIVRLILISLFVLVLFSIYMALDWAETALPYLYAGIKNYAFNFSDHIGSNNSLGKRISQVMWSVSENELYIVGVGILKEKVRLLESWFALYYVRYGLIGMISYLAFWFVLFVFSVVAARRFFRAGELVKSSYLVGFSGIVFSLPPLLLSSVPTDFMPTLFTYYAFAAVSIVLCIESSKYKQTPNQRSLIIS
ncbi:MAG: hypothetical protein WEA82_05220 [Idiomarina sp.]